MKILKFMALIKRIACGANRISPIVLSFSPVGNPSSIQKDSGQAGMTDFTSCNWLHRSLLLLVLTSYYILPSTVYAKMYIDISSPGSRKLPIAIQEFSGTSGKQIADIVQNDLEVTGLFAYVDRAAYLEKPLQPFNQKNWTPIRVEAVVKGSVTVSKDLVVTAALYDVFEGKEIFRKE